MSLEITQLDNERLHSMALSINHQLCKHHCNVCLKTAIAWPVFSRRDGGTVKNELVAGFVEGGGGLEALHIGPMAKLCLRVRSKKCFQL